MMRTENTAQSPAQVAKTRNPLEISDTQDPQPATDTDANTVQRPVEIARRKRMGIIDSINGDWPEDFSHENGNYFCKCCQCGQTFTGHKRRVVCKSCAI